MIRHCVLVSLGDETPPEAATAIVEALRRLPGQIPDIRTYEVGLDLGWRDGNPEIGIVATFDDESGWRTYVGHPAHVAVIDEHFAPHATGRSSVQFEI
jgi:hypothetical protein